MNTSTHKRPPMLALLLKDFRLCKPVLLASLIALFIPITAFLLGVLIDHGLPSPVHPGHVREFRQELLTLMVIGLMLCSITLPALAAVAAARERRDRSGEFLSSLPIRRTHVVMSRIAIVSACFAILWFIGAGAAEILRPADADGLFTTRGNRPSDFSPGALLLAVHLLVIGAGWLLGSLLRSETIAAACAMGGCTLFGLFLASQQKRLEHAWTSPGHAPEFFYFNFLIWVLIATGAAMFFAGTVIAVRRTSP